MVVETKTIFISTAVLFFYNFALCKLKVLLHFTVLCFFEFVECEGEWHDTLLRVFQSQGNRRAARAFEGLAILFLVVAGILFLIYVSLFLR